MSPFQSFNAQITVDSPGRINLIGEHTDYNEGWVLPTAIDKKIILKFNRNDSKNRCNVYSENFNVEFSFNLDEVKISENEWENYILGVVFEIQQVSNLLQGFDCVLSSDIPVGSGVSSSAALECGLAFGLNELFNLGLSKLQMVQLSQRAEHHFVGTKCGIMDQFASVMSKKDHVILLDCQTVAYEYVPIQIAPYKLLLLNTNVTHSLASSEYNTRREECESGVRIISKKYPEVKSLRDVSKAMLIELNGQLPKLIYSRCKYVVEENLRVISAVGFLKENKLKQFGELMYSTHEGLSKEYQVSCPELDFLVNFSKDYDSILGARMMGGGFGGCTINLILESAVQDFVSKIKQEYFEAFGIQLDSIEVNPSAGTACLNLLKNESEF